MENIGFKVLEELNFLSEKDTVVLIHSCVITKKLNLLLEQETYKPKIKTYEITTGYKDALDFKLITYALLMFRNGYTDIVVVSNDKGYLSIKDAIIEFMLIAKLNLYYTHTLEYISDIYKFENGFYTHYERFFNNCVILDNKEGIVQLEKPVYKLVSKKDYITKKVKKPKIIEENTETQVEDSFDKFLKDNGIVIEEKGVLTVKTPVEVQESIKPKLPKDAILHKWQSFCDRLLNTGKIRKYSERGLQQVYRLKQGAPLSLEDTIQIMGAATGRKKSQLREITEIYNKVMLK